jgi:hypothetical protein
MTMPHGAFIFGLIATLMIAVVIVRAIPAKVSGLNRKEMAVVRRAAGRRPLSAGAAAVASSASSSSR